MVWVQLVERTLDVLTILSREPEGLSVTDLAERMGIPGSSTHRILTCLKKNRFVSQDSDTKRYRIGYKVLTLCANITEENSFTRTAKPFMRELADRLGKTVTLCVMEGANVICLDYIESKDTAMFFVRTGFAMPTHATSAGKAMLAYRPESQVRHLYHDNTNEQLTSYTKTDLEALLEEFTTIRQQGYAVCDEELQLGVQGVACPIFDYFGKVVGSVSYTALKADQALTEENIGLLRDCAARISQSIGNTRLEQE